MLELNAKVDKRVELAARLLEACIEAKYKSPNNKMQLQLIEQLSMDISNVNNQISNTFKMGDVGSPVFKGQ